MQRALKEAQAAAIRNEVPIGAVIVREGKIIAANGNRTEEMHDPTAHAEMLVIRQACEVMASPRLPECDLYVTLEPCSMCATAISFARIRRLYFGATDPKGGGVLHGAKVFTQTTCHHRPEVYDGIAQNESAAMLKTFFAGKR